jgi:hypothetical protein
MALVKELSSLYASTCRVVLQPLAPGAGCFQLFGRAWGGTFRRHALWEGQAAHNVSILCCGQVKLTTSCKEGKTLLVRIAKPRDVLGSSAAMSATLHETTV